MKNQINLELVEKLSAEIKASFPAFPSRDFCAVGPQLEGLELKARVLKVSEKLLQCLPADYPEALEIITAAMRRGRLKGFELWPFSEYIGKNGLDHFDLSLSSMITLTQYFTAEWAVRPYLLKDQDRVLRFLGALTAHENVHVRRWISEGTRPLLPWGSRLPALVADPSPGLVLLEQLRLDDELYVRKSVANHLNDISKHHPGLVIEVIRKWAADCPSTDLPKIHWIKRQGLRSLIKAGHPGALRLMGVKGPAKVRLSGVKLNQKEYSTSDVLTFEFSISSEARRSQLLVVDYRINFLKSNGSMAAKTFKLKTMELAAGETAWIKKSHSLKPITTRTLYPGKHELQIQINGAIIAQKSWLLRDQLGRR